MSDELRELAPGEAMKWMRENAGLSQRRLSESLGRASSWVGVSENPMRGPSLSTICRVAAACGLGIEVYELSTGAPVAKIKAPRDVE